MSQTFRLLTIGSGLVKDWLKNRAKLEELKNRADQELDGQTLGYLCIVKELIGYYNSKLSRTNPKTKASPSTERNSKSHIN